MRNEHEIERIVKQIERIQRQIGETELELQAGITVEAEICLETLLSDLADCEYDLVQAEKGN